MSRWWRAAMSAKWRHGSKAADAAPSPFRRRVHAPFSEHTHRVFSHAYEFDEGFMFPGDAPGLGVDIDESLAAKCPYEPDFLPINRRTDGTIHSR